MNNFQSILVFCGVMMIIIMAFPTRAERASKTIINISTAIAIILKALPVSGMSKIAVALINKTKK